MRLNGHIFPATTIWERNPNQLINPQAKVIDKNGKVIEGLFAAGEVTGGVHGKNRLGGNSISETITFGRISGEEAAKRIANN